MRRFVNAFVALVISASLVAGALGVRNQMSGEEGENAAYTQAIEAIRASEQLAAQWSAEVGRVKNQSDADFDALKDFIPQLVAESDRLVDAQDRMEDLPDEVKNRIRSYLSRLEAKQGKIERFKTDHAVVRNSQDFLLSDPEGAKALLRSSREGGRSAVENAATLMLDELGQFLRTPTNAWRNRTGAALEALAATGAGTPDAAKIAEISRHVEVLLERWKLAEDRFQEAISNENVSTSAAGLVSRLDADRSANRIYVVYLGYAFYAMVGLALVYWTYLVMRSLGLPRRRRREEEAPGPDRVEQATWRTDEMAEEYGADEGREGGAAPAWTPAWTPAREPLVERVPRPPGEAPGMSPGMSPGMPMAEEPPGAGSAPAGRGARADAPAPAEGLAGHRPGVAQEQRAAPPAAPAPPEAPAYPAAPAHPVREAGEALTTRVLIQAVAGKFAEIAAELDQANEAGEALRGSEHGDPEQALAALLGRLAGARWSAHRLVAQTREMLGGEEAGAGGHAERVDLHAVLAGFLADLDPVHRGRITATLLPGAFAQVDPLAFETAVDRVLGHALEAAARHPGGAGHVELTLTTFGGRHCISCIDHGPGMAAGGGMETPRDTLDVDIARRLIVAQGGEFEAVSYPPHGSLIRIRLHPAPEAATPRQI